MKTPRINPREDTFEPLRIAEERQRQMRLEHAFTVLLWEDPALIMAMDDSIMIWNILLKRSEDINQRLKALENKPSNN